MTYDHTQRSPLQAILLFSGLTWSAAMIVIGFTVTVTVVSVFFATIMTLVAFSVGYLRVADAGDHLRVRFGPIPVLGTRVPYAAVTAVEAVRSDVLDGWGVHWVPGRGTIYNLWGFDCVRICMGEKVVRVGTDDVEGLVTFLKARTGLSPE